MSKLKSESAVFKEQMPLPLSAFVYLSRAIFLVSAFVVPSTAVFSLIAFVLTYLTFFFRVTARKGSFSASLNYRITALICASSLVSCFVGKTLGVLQKYPDYDIVMSLVTGVVGTVFGYYLISSMKKIENKRDVSFIASSALFINGTIIFFREMLEFFSDFLFGTNYIHAEQIPDDHWFFRLFGVGSNIMEQRPLYDTDEDMLISILFSFVTTALLYLFLRRKNKALFIKEKVKKTSDEKFFVKAYNKALTEVQIVREETNIYDMLTWWLTRVVMLYAFILMEDPLEKPLIGANLLATFAITLLHLVFPKGTLFGDISYRMQSWLCLIVFTGSYMGNFIFVYNHLPRFDLFLHFISGPIAVAAGYYAIKTFMTPKTKKEVFLAALYAFAFSCFVMPAWEVFEFMGDFLFGTANQGYYWGPTEQSFFFKVFGHGVGNTNLYYLFDTVYDVLLAFVTTVVSVLWLYISLLKGVKKTKAIKGEEKITVNC